MDSEYTCDQCDFKTPHKGSLTRHKNRNHKPPSSASKPAQKDDHHECQGAGCSHTGSSIPFPLDFGTIAQNEETTKEFIAKIADALQRPENRVVSDDVFVLENGLRIWEGLLDANRNNPFNVRQVYNGVQVTKMVRYLLREHNVRKTHVMYNSFVQIVFNNIIELCIENPILHCKFITVFSMMQQEQQT